MSQVFSSSAFVFGASCMCASFLLSLVSIPILHHLAPQIGLLDRPGGRKQHKGAVPLVGGLGISMAVIGTLLVVGFDWFGLWYLTVSWVMLLVTGIIDDRRAVRSVVKFAVECAVATLIVVGEAESIRRVGDMVFDPGASLDVFYYLIAFFFIVGFINAFNMIDGADGLAGSLALTMTAAFLLVADMGGWPSMGGTLLLATIGAVLGFLIFNSRVLDQQGRYRVFLGDAGSMVLGVLVAWYAIRLAGTPVANPRSAGMVAWIVAYPVVDAVSVMVLRMMQGRHPFTPDRQHLHHLLLARGMSINATVAVLNGMAWLGIGYAFLGHALGFSDVVLVVSILVLMMVHFGLVYRLRGKQESRDRREVGTDPN